MKREEYERPRGHEVRALRQAAGLSQSQFAERLREKVQNIKNWETEKDGRLMPASTWLLAQMRFTRFVPCQKCPAPEACSAPDIRECLQELGALAGLTFLGPAKAKAATEKTDETKRRRRGR